MSGHNGFSNLAKLLVRYPSQRQKEDLKQALLKVYTQETLIDLLAHEVMPARRAAAYALGIIGDMQAVEPLVEKLRHEDPGMRFNVEQALWTIWFRSGNESVDATLREGAQSIKKERYGDAIEKLTEVIRVAPEFAEGYNQRAIAYFMLEEWEKSIEDCKTTVSLNPFHFSAFAGMGHCYLRLGYIREAMNAYQRALEINPNLYAIAHTIFQLQVALREHFGEK